MGRTSNRVAQYISAKGKMKEMSTQDIYYKTVELRTVLCDIANNHKKWGNEWYRLVEMSLFDSAKTAVLIGSKGTKNADAVVDTICYINELADLEKCLLDR